MDATRIANQLQRLRGLVEFNADWIWEVDDQIRFVYSSAKGAEWLGYPQEQILGKSPFDFMPHEEIIRVAGAYRQFQDGRKPFQGLVNHLLRADGSAMAFETSAVPVFDAGGHFRGYRGINRDITHISTRVYQLESLYISAPSILYVVDRNLHYLAVNKAMARVNNMSIDDLVGRSVRILRPERARELEDDFATAGAGLPVPDREFEWQGHYYHSSATPLRDGTGKIIALSIALTDVTERRQTRLALAEANRRLERYRNASPPEPDES